MKLAKIGVLGVIAAFVFAACSQAPGSSGAAGGKTIKIGTELPMSGAETANGEPTANGVKLAIKQANAKNAIPGYTLDIHVQDDAVNGAHDPPQGAANLHTLVADTSVIGVVGPFNSSGGTVTKRDSAPKSTPDYTPLFTAAAAAKPAAVYLAGTTPTGMGLALKQGRTVAGFETIPFVGPDGVADLGPGGTTGATITVAGQAAHDVHGTVAGVHALPSGSTFIADYTAEYGNAPGAYS